MACEATRIDSVADSSAFNPAADSPPEERPRASMPLLVLASLAGVAAVYYARDLIVPVVLALLLAMLLRPVFRRLQRWHVPDVVASLLVVAVVAILFATALAGVVNQGQAWLAQTPDIVKRIGALLPQSGGPLAQLAQATEAVRQVTHTGAEQDPLPVEIRSSEHTVSVLGASGHFVAASLIVFVLAFFLLSFSDTLLRQAIESRSSFSEKRSVVTLVHNVENGISRYLGTITLINIGLGLVTATVLWLLGTPNPLLWGVMATVLNYVPHVGAMACLSVLFIVGSVAHESLWHGAMAAGAFGLITTVESYLVTPLVLSRSLQLSPLAVILSVLFWGWLWGIAGGLMAAPLLAIAKITCDQFESLRPLGRILSGEEGSNERGAAAAQVPLRKTVAA